MNPNDIIKDFCSDIESLAREWWWVCIIGLAVLLAYITYALIT